MGHFSTTLHNTPYSSRHAPHLLLPEELLNVEVALVHDRGELGSLKRPAGDHRALGRHGVGALRGRLLHRNLRPERLVALHQRGTVGRERGEGEMSAQVV